MSKVLDLIDAAHGQCRLTYVSATSLKLSPYNGRNLAINGQLQQIPSSGVTVSNSGLAASTVYYVYAYMNGTTMTLELSTTGHTAANGIETKTGDTSRSLVGMAYTNSSSQFQDGGAVIGVLSYFNRRRKPSRVAFTANRTLAYNTAYSEVNTELRIGFLTWADETVCQTITGSWAISVNGSACTCYASIDGSTANPLQAQVTTSTSQLGFTSSDERLVTEGYHYGTMLGSTYLSSGSSATFVGGANGQVSQVLSVMG